MKNDPSSNPPASSELSLLHERVSAGVRSHQRKIRMLAGLAFFLGFVAVAASMLTVVGYFVFYRPKEKEVLRQVTLAAERAKANRPAGETSPDARLPFDFPSVQATMTFFHSIVITLLAGAVGLLALGTLTLVVVVLLSRRATLHQINENLIQISTQLKLLQPRPPSATLSD